MVTTKKTGRRDSSSPSTLTRPRVLLLLLHVVLLSEDSIRVFGGGTYSTDFYDDNCSRDASISPFSTSYSSSSSSFCAREKR